jgi:probable phosphoglycerate mutase
MQNSFERVQAASGFRFLRHGETDFNRSGLRCGGDADVPLSVHGEEQIRALAPQTGFLGIVAIVSSALQRARRSALIISSLLGGIPILTQSLFNERSLGAWNGRPYAETEALIRAGATPPGGEAAAQFRQRILSGVAGLSLAQNTLVASSKGVARILDDWLGGASCAPRPMEN